MFSIIREYPPFFENKSDNRPNHGLNTLQCAPLIGHIVKTHRPMGQNNRPLDILINIRYICV